MNYPVDKMCKCMNFSKSSYYHWLKNKNEGLEESPKSNLKQKIKKMFDNSRQIYGSNRIQKNRKRRYGLFTLPYCKADEQIGLEKCFETKIYCDDRFKTCTADCE